jgi:hypothetical protein
VLGIGRGLALCFTRLRTLPLVHNVVPVPRVPATGNSNLDIGSLAPINASAPTNSRPQRGCKRDSRAAIYSVADGSYNVGYEGLPTCAFAVRARSLPPFGRTLQRSPPGCGRIFRVPDPDREKAARRRASVGSAAHKSQMKLDLRVGAIHMLQLINLGAPSSEATTEDLVVEQIAENYVRLPPKVRRK